MTISRNSVGLRAIALFAVVAMAGTALAGADIADTEERSAGASIVFDAHRNLWTSTASKHGPGNMSLRVPSPDMLGDIRSLDQRIDQCIDYRIPGQVSGMDVGLDRHTYMIASKGPYLYVTSYPESDVVIMRRGMDMLEHVGTIEMNGSGRDVCISDDHLFVSGRYDGIIIADIADPESPVIVGRIDEPGGMGISFMAVDDGLLVYATMVFGLPLHNYLTIVDVQDPAHPVKLSVIQDFENTREMVFSHGKLFVADISIINSGIHVLDLTHPENPVRNYFLADPGRASGLAVVGDHMFVTDMSGLAVLDVSDASTPVLVTRMDMVETDRIAVSEGIAYLTSPYDGMLVVDIGIPAGPELLAEHPLQGETNDVHLHGKNIIVSSQDGGLYVERMQCPFTETQPHGATAPMIMRDSAVRTLSPVTRSVAVCFRLTRRMSIRCDVYDVRGRLVDTIADQVFGAGDHELNWDGRDQAGRYAGSGAYLAVLSGDGVVGSQRVLVVK